MRLVGIVLLPLLLVLGACQSNETGGVRPDQDFANLKTSTRLCKSGTIDPDKRIDSCTWLLKSGDISENDYSHVYQNRGYGHLYKSQYDRAIRDYDEAIRLNPKIVFAYSGRGYAY